MEEGYLSGLGNELLKDLTCPHFPPPAEQQAFRGGSLRHNLPLWQPMVSPGSQDSPTGEGEKEQHPPSPPPRVQTLQSRSPDVPLASSWFLHFALPVPAPISPSQSPSTCPVYPLLTLSWKRPPPSPQTPFRHPIPDLLLPLIPTPKFPSDLPVKPLSQFFSTGPQPPFHLPTIPSYSANTSPQAPSPTPP